MFCARCQSHLSACVCPDLNDRLKEMSSPAGRMVIRWCRGCDKSYHQCRCKRPDWYVRGGPEPEKSP